MPAARVLLHPAAKPVVFVAALLPFAWLVYAAAADRLGANPAEALIRSSGDWTLRFLCLTLAVTPLRVAAESGTDDIAERLRGAGAKAARTTVLSAAERVDPNVRAAGSAQWPALIAAAHRGQTDTVDTLLARGADVNITDLEGQSALTRAAAGGHATLVATLVARVAVRRKLWIELPHRSISSTALGMSERSPTSSASEGSAPGRHRSGRAR